MKRVLFLCALLLGLAGQSLAQPSVTPGGRQPSNLGKWVQIKILDDGTQVVIDALGPAAMFDFRPAAVSATFANVADGQATPGLRSNRDSSNVIDTRGYNRMQILAFPSAGSTPGGDSSADSLYAALGALEMRAHYSTVADSQSTFRVIPHFFTGSDPAKRDSIGTLVSAARYSASTPLSLLTSALNDETVLVIDNIGGPNRGIVIFDGRINEPASESVPPLFSLRYRPLGGYTMAGVTTPAFVSGLAVRIRFDVILWRE